MKDVAEALKEESELKSALGGIEMENREHWKHLYDWLKSALGGIEIFVASLLRCQDFHNNSKFIVGFFHIPEKLLK